MERAKAYHLTEALDHRLNTMYPGWQITVREDFVARLQQTPFRKGPVVRVTWGNLEGRQNGSGELITYEPMHIVRNDALPSLDLLWAAFDGILDALNFYLDGRYARKVAHNENLISLLRESAVAGNPYSMLVRVYQQDMSDYTKKSYHRCLIIIPGHLEDKAVLDWELRNVITYRRRSVESEQKLQVKEDIPQDWQLA